MLEPVSVGLKLAFLAVLYLFLLWVARSALKDLRRPVNAGPARSRAVNRRTHVVRAQRCNHVVGREQLVGRCRSGDGGVRVSDRVPVALHDDLGEILLGASVTSEHGLALQCGEGHVVGADRREVVGVELEGQRLAQRHTEARAA